MARGVNKVFLIGVLGKDPEVKYTQAGKAVCSFSIATSESWTDKASGEKKEATEWHNITVFDKAGENCGQYLAKGKSVYVEGKLKTEKYTDKTGVEKYTTKIIADQVVFLSPNDAKPTEQAKPAARMSPARVRPAAASDVFEDEIPF